MGWGSLGACYWTQLSATQEVQLLGAVPGPQVPAPSQKVWVSVDEFAHATAQTVEESTLVQVPSLPATAQL